VAGRKGSPQHQVRISAHGEMNGELFRADPDIVRWGAYLRGGAYSSLPAVCFGLLLYWGEGRGVQLDPTQLGDQKSACIPTDR